MRSRVEMYSKSSLTHPSRQVIEVENGEAGEDIREVIGEDVGEDLEGDSGGIKDEGEGEDVDESGGVVVTLDITESS
jgi:hypothetical protein